MDFGPEVKTKSKQLSKCPQKSYPNIPSKALTLQKIISLPSGKPLSQLLPDFLNTQYFTFWHPSVQHYKAVKHSCESTGLFRLPKSTRIIQARLGDRGRNSWARKVIFISKDNPLLFSSKPAWVTLSDLLPLVEPVCLSRLSSHGQLARGWYPMGLLRLGSS